MGLVSVLKGAIICPGIAFHILFVCLWMVELEGCMQKKILIIFLFASLTLDKFVSKIAAYMLNTCKQEWVFVIYIGRFYYNNYHNAWLYILEKTVTYDLKTHLTKEITDCYFIILSTKLFYSTSKNEMWTCNNIQKIALGRGDDYTISFPLDHFALKKLLRW